MPTLSQLEYIIAVDRYRHFGRAASACHVSQPSLSMQVQKVEEELGLTLFDRLKKPIIPTERGQKFIEQAKVVIRESQKLESLSKQKHGALSGNFNLAVIPTLAPYLLPLFLEPFSLKYPEVKLGIDELKTETILSKLHSGDIDAALLATPLEDSSLRERVLFYEPFYLFVSPANKISQAKQLVSDDLQASEMWLLEEGHCLKEQITKFCSIARDATAFQNIRFQGGSLETLRYLIRKSHGYTLVPHLFVNSLVAKERREWVKPFSGAAPCREISLVARRGHWKTEIISAVENIIRESLPKDLPTQPAPKKLQILKI